MLYALKVRKSDLELITLLNNGYTPEVKKTETYFIFEIEDGGKTIRTKVVTKREMLQNYDIYKTSPLLLRLKKYA